MKKYLKLIFLNLVILWALAGLIPAISYTSFQELLITTLILSMLQLFVLPVIVLLFMPIQLLSFGSLKWVPPLLMLLLFNWLSTGYTIGSMTIPSITYRQISLPTIHLGSMSSLVLFGVLYSYSSKLVHWILK